jgi:hypothetical protein
VVHLDAIDVSMDVGEAIRATTADTEDDIREAEEDEAVTRRALDLLGSHRNDAYEAALAALREAQIIEAGDAATALAAVIKATGVAK